MSLKVVLIGFVLFATYGILHAQDQAEKKGDGNADAKLKKLERFILFRENLKSPKSSDILKFQQLIKENESAKSTEVGIATQQYESTQAVAEIGASALSEQELDAKITKAMNRQLGSKASVGSVKSTTVYHPDLTESEVVTRRNRISGQSRFDSRIEVRQLNPLVEWENTVLTAAGSVGLIIRKADLTKVTDSLYRISANVTLAKRFNLCAGEPFAHQPVAGSGTGTLIAEREILTAGHVFEETIDNYVLLFGYEMENGAGDFERFISVNDVYGFKKVLHWSDDLDIVHVSLDRACSRPALKLSTIAGVALKTEVYMVGFPSGLPQKVAMNASVYKSDDRYCFYTTLDAFQVNSGSPVFNRNTNEVIGILVSGSSDYLWTGGCNITRTCELPFCDGEKVIRIEEIFAQFK